VNTKILSIVSDIDKNMNSFRSDIIINFNDKLNQTKKEYIEDLKTQLTNNILSNNEKISSIIDKNAETILSKTTSIINDIVPKSQDKNYTQVENCIKLFCSSIERDTKKLLETKSNDDNSAKMIIDNIENNFSKMVSSIQSPILHLIQSSEERTTSGIQKVKDEFLQQQITQEKLTTELNDFLNKYKNNSSLKGCVSENELYYMLQSVMPTDEIVRVSSDTASCDFRVNRKNKERPTILFENKDYNRNVTTDEVVKFERDIQLQKIHGIFVSQKTPITFKENFQVDIINNLVHVYIPSCQYDTEKLKIAIDIVDSLSSKLNVLNSNTNSEDTVYSTTKMDMDDLANEYRNFAIQKTSIQEMVKAMSKQLLDKLEEVQLPKIKNILIRFGMIENENLKCPYCSIYEGKNKASLSAHLRNCKANSCKKKEDIEEIIIETVAE
ncbi:MAG: hypothetical protein EBS86_15370, partial [Crocinitomicaceae bacterium]|nr:hypothetical protein [Crocinitomicaceae bacterium]